MWSWRSPDVHHDLPGFTGVWLRVSVADTFLFVLVVLRTTNIYRK